MYYVPCSLTGANARNDKSLFSNWGNRRPLYVRNENGASTEPQVATVTTSELKLNKRAAILNLRPWPGACTNGVLASTFAKLRW